MKRTVFFMLILVVAVSCTPMQPALTASSPVENLPVKGRQGLLINQKLTFGDFQTSKVKRSWTRGGENILGIPVGRFNRDFLSYQSVGKDQDFFFVMEDPGGNRAEVFALSQLASQDIQLDKSSGTFSEDSFSINLKSENIFYIQLFLNGNNRAWELLLDNEAAQIFAKEYQGIFAYDEDNYYTLKPITKVQGKKGPENLLLGSIGYEIFNKKEEPVAAVSLVDSGNVYLYTQDPEERFLMANLCAALLLQEDLEEF